MGAKQILIINGPNLNLLGKRESAIYGDKSFEEYFVDLKKLFSDFELDYFQTNVEGEIITKIQQSNHSGIILNAGGYTHTSVAIRDAISAVKIPVVEVHISNIAARESFRHESLITPVCAGCVFGFGLMSYELALNYFRK
ncbi:MAG: type II 3-dehydroquinate dehydratase [Crocinitomicaceae bacterium]|nr:type II 3-dehydroquinate dehydratase [Crocinitomicaceae bacterium]